MRAELAHEMVSVLGDGGLYEFTGGRALTESELSAKYRAQTVGRSPDGSQLWFNWIVRVRETGGAAGYVQATITGAPRQQRAELAWVLGEHNQWHGYAREAVQLVLARLQADGVRQVVAHIHPRHHASEAVARHIEMTPSGSLVDGEQRWERTL